ncbi:energy-coupling factor transporter transmembrane protein EcfT [Streptococcus suis]|nr:energy-coupling factor transporter transmembrane protein EcfT [Streptococcus suis]
MKLDARSKILLVVFTSLTYGMRLSGLENAVLVCGLILVFWFSGKPKMALVGLLGYGLFLSLSYWTVLPGLLLHLLVLMTYIWPPLLAGHLLLMTTSSYELIHGLRKWRLPETFLLTLGVMFRFLPAIKSDARHIQASLKVRGIFLSKWALFVQPLRYMEYFLVPLMLSLLATAQDLTVATLTKGIALSGRPSEFVKSGWTWLDWSLCLCCLIFLLWIRLSG